MTPTLPQALGRLRVALEDAFVRSSREVGLTPQQAELLCAAIAPSAIRDLASILRCDRSNVTRLVDRAADRGLVSRSGEDDDGRITLVQLTAEGALLASRFLAVLEAQTERVTSGWPETRIETAARLIEEISASLDASRPPPRRRRRSAG